MDIFQLLLNYIRERLPPELVRDTLEETYRDVVIEGFTDAAAMLSPLVTGN